LRLKLTAWFVLVFFVIQASLLGGVVYSRRETIPVSLDEHLGRSAESTVDNILTAEVEWDGEQILSLLPKEAGFVLFAIRDRQGDVLASWGVHDAGELPFSAMEVVPAGPVGGVHALIRPERARELTGRSQRLRLVTLPFRYGGELFYFQAAVRDEGLDRRLGPFFDLVVLGGPVGLVAAIAAGWVIAGRVVAPIRRLSRAARSVSPDNLNERFDVPTTDREVAGLEDELNSALERIEAAYRAQDQFISNVSHELRTPVAVLLAQAQVAKMGERSLEKGYAFVDRAELLLKRLGKLVESFLVLARADLGKRAPSDTVSMIDVVLGCVHRCQELAEQNRVRLIPRLEESDGEEVGLSFPGDPELLQTMVENLVLNGLSHSPPGGEVGLEVFRSRESACIVVRDEGPGIPEAYLERVFDRFVQVPGDAARRNGVGLGLAIANGIAQLHGGTIEVENNEGGGCSFVVRLPLEAADAGDPESQRPVGDPVGGHGG